MARSDPDDKEVDPEMSKHACIVPGCHRDAPHQLTLRLRRPDTTAMWAPKTDAYLCDDHAQGGMFVDIMLQPTKSRSVEIHTQAEKDGQLGDEAFSTLKITQGPRRTVV